MSNQTIEKTNGAATAPIVNTTPAPLSPVRQVQNAVAQYMMNGTLHLPSDYSPDNAMKSAGIALKEVQGLSGCSEGSIVNSLLDMVVQGLNPAKKQCYFIAYGNKLVCQRSYFGDMALAQRIKPGLEFYYGVIREGHTFETDGARGKNIITKHVKPFECENNPIIGAYCGAYDESGVDLGCDVMTMERIRKSWEMSKVYKEGSTTGTHARFPDEMGLRTVIRHYCKSIINAASDALLMEFIRRQEIEGASIDAEITAENEANTLALSDAVEATVGTETAEAAPAAEAAQASLESEF